MEDYFPGVDKYRTIDVEESTTVGALLERMDYKRYEHYILVNGSFKTHDYILQNGDHLVVMPVLSGG